ncbi:MAG: M28 family peptidase [Candidatus Poseidoniaceae archaeon]|nr:M28 family peptidase [Candidatus Poseidoniaceae archaeon]
MSDEPYEAELVDFEVADLSREKDLFKPLFDRILLGTFVVLFLTSATLYYVLSDSEMINYSQPDFDQESARTYAEDLIALGHPDWKGRMSGSAEELATAEYIIQHFEDLGYQPQLNTYQVPMHSIDGEPSLSVCTPGSTSGLIVPCSPADFGANIQTFNHRMDYVIQGFSGREDIGFGDNVDVIHLGNGSDDSLWAAASGSVGYIVGGGSIGGNTQIMTKAIENGLTSVIRVNKDYNCGKIEGNDCVPIFKGTSIDAMKEANGGTIPNDIAFIAMSKDAGEIFEEIVINGSGRLEMMIDVTNDNDLTIRVPCGIMYGTTEELLIVGGHHDTVYHGPGAVDDTSGTASVLEMARMFSEIFAEKGIPDRTVKFCTWGGEEEGLWGSTYYVNDNKEDLTKNLRLYVNLDMNHVDIDYSERGNTVRLFANHPEDYQHISDITVQYLDDNPDIASKYEILLYLLDGDQGSDKEMPCNSDHCPFVYQLDDGKRGRAAVCYGSGSWEYHTYLDDIDRFNEESLGISVTIYGAYIQYLAYNIES